MGCSYFYGYGCLRGSRRALYSPYPRSPLPRCPCYSFLSPVSVFWCRDFPFPVLRGRIFGSCILLSSPCSGSCPDFTSASGPLLFRFGFGSVLFRFRFGSVFRSGFRSGYRSGPFGPALFGSGPFLLRPFLVRVFLFGLFPSVRSVF